MYFCRVGFAILATYDDAGIPVCDLCVVIAGGFEESSVACLLSNDVSSDFAFAFARSAVCRISRIQRSRL